MNYLDLLFCSIRIAMLCGDAYTYVRTYVWTYVHTYVQQHQIHRVIFLFIFLKRKKKNRTYTHHLAFATTSLFFTSILKSCDSSFFQLEPRLPCHHFYINKLAAFCNHNLFLCLAFFVSLGIVCVYARSVSLCTHPSWWRWWWWCDERHCNNSHLTKFLRKEVQGNQFSKDFFYLDIYLVN